MEEDGAGLGEKNHRCCSRISRDGAYTVLQYQ